MAKDGDGATLSILEQYLSELRDIHTTGGGVAETSYYPALSNLFNRVGKKLKPRVRWHHDNRHPNARFDWRMAEWSLHVPFIRSLYESGGSPLKLRALV